MPILKSRSVSKIFQRLKALDDIILHLTTALFLSGPVGLGKTTLLRSIAALKFPSRPISTIADKSEDFIEERYSRAAVFRASLLLVISELWRFWPP